MERTTSLALTVPLCLVLLLGVAPHALSAPQGAVVQDRELSRLQDEFVRLAETVGGSVGVGVRHMETGREVYLNRAMRFPMGSVFKLPLAVQLLSLVDARVVALDKTVVLKPDDLRPGSGNLAKTFRASRDISLRQLLESMLIDSDNSATDILWNEAGGSAAIMARLAVLEISGMSVNRPTALLLAAAAGLGPLPKDTALTPSQFDKLIRQVPQAERRERKAALFKDRRDTATPEAAVALLSKIWQQKAVSPGQTELLMDIMYRCNTGKQRLRGRLPPGTKVAHKTGTLRPSVVNDIGIISLPGRAGHVAVAVMIKESTKDIATQERVIAEIARLTYDHFVSGAARAN